MHEHTRFSMRTLLIIIIASFGGFLFGYHTAVISGVLHLIKSSFKLDSLQEGFAVSTILLGGFIGSLVAGPCADKLGRKRLMQITAVFFCIGALIIGFSNSFEVFIVGRFVTGIAVGLTSVVTPMYLAEIAPAKLRGRFVSLFQLMLAFGILFAYGVNAVFIEIDGWKVVFIISFIPSMLQLIAIFYLQESPIWIVTHKERASSSETHTEHHGKKHEVLEKNYKYIVLIGLLLSIFQQITGVNTVMYYAPKIFSNSGAFSEDKALLATLIIGVINCIATFFSFWFLDKIGRRTLLILGTFGMMFFQILLFFVLEYGQTQTKIFPLISLMGFVSCFAIGLGPILWVILSEVFPLKIRGRAMSLCVFANWISNYFVSLTFPILISILNASGAFLIYGLISLVAAIFIYYFIPETKGKSLEEIEFMVSKRKI